MSTTRRSTSDRSPHQSQKVAAPPIEVLNRQRHCSIDRTRAARLARRVLDQIGLAEASLQIVFVGDRRMRQLNRTYRGIDRPTDVLSFAYHETADPEEESGEGQASPDHLADPENLGDLVISVETAQRYALEAGIDFQREVDQLVLHGTLHLAGYDHEVDNGEMNRLERRLRQRLLATDGVASPSLDQPPTR
ncbi:MAG: rRNA maturation RNase YbeY [Blastocatellia bacterium]